MMDFGLHRWLRTLDLDQVGSDLEMLDAEEVGCMGGAADDAIAKGNRDENALTDLEFNARHPERLLLRDPKIQPGEKDLAKEWMKIREEVVRPALGRAGALARPASAASSPASSLPVPAPAAIPPAPGSNAAVAEQVVATNKRNQMIAAGLGVVAVVGIIIGATR